MERRNFFKGTLLATGSLLAGGAIIHRLLRKKTESTPLLPVIEKIRDGKKKNVLVVMSAGTRGGNTDRLTDAYIQGLAKGDHSVTKVYLGSMRIEGCRGCGVCQRLARRCAIRDDMQEIYPLFAACDTVVMASPLYFWTISSRLKAFIERLYAISVEDKYPPKDSVLLLTAGDRQERTFEQPLRYFRLLNEALGWNLVGAYGAGGCTGCEKTARRIDLQHLEAAYRMGMELDSKSNSDSDSAERGDMPDFSSRRS